MKKCLCILLGVVLTTCCSCRNFMFSHNAYQVADGKVFRLGTPEFNLTFVRGTVTTMIVRENTEAVVETNNGDAVGKPTGTFRGLTTARFRTGPQMTGYLKDVARRDPVTARKYVEQMSELNKAQWDVQQKTPVDISPVQPEPLQTVTEKIKSVVEPFTCPNANCELTNLWKDNRIAYQTAVATKLLTYADDTTAWEGEVTTFKKSLEMFLTRMAQLTAKGKTTTCMRVKYARINGKLVDLNYVMIEDDGREFDTHCPECVPLED